MSAERWRVYYMKLQGEERCGETGKEWGIVI